MSKQIEAVNLLRSMTAEDLAEHLRLQRRKLFEVRFQQAAGQVENHRQVRELRREIARTMTLQLELARGHHLVSDLEVEEEPEERPEERPRPRGLLRRRSTAVSPVEAEPAETGAAGRDAVEAEPVESGPERRPRAARRRRDSAASMVEEPESLETPDAAAEEPPVADGETAEPADAAEFADEGAAGPDEEQADE